MPRPLPPLSWFRSFEAAARLLSSTAAASEIGLTQSAISQHILSLESRLGVVLFHRRPRGLALTDEGRKLLPQVEHALRTLQAATDPYFTEDTDSTITVAASISIIEYVISPALSGFRSQGISPTIRFIGAIWPDDFAAKSANPIADVEIRFGSERQVGTNAVALTPNTLIAVKSPKLTSDLRDAPLIEAVGTSDGWSAWGKVAGIDGLKPTRLVDSYGLAVRLAQDGNGVALVNQGVASNAMNQGTLCLAHEASLPAQEGYYLSVLRDGRLAQDFASWVQHCYGNPAN